MLATLEADHFFLQLSARLAHRFFFNGCLHCITSSTTMTSIRTMDSGFNASAEVVAGMSCGCKTFDICMDAPACKRRIGGHTGLTGAPVELRYVYTVKYLDGRLTLHVRCDGAVDPANARTFCGDMSVKDWRLFRSEVFADLEQCGFPEALYVSQWCSDTGPEMFRVETDRFNRHSDDFIFLCLCEDRGKMISLRGRDEWRVQPYPISPKEYDSWFKTFFFIQRCDWRALQRLLNEIDTCIKRDRVHSCYEGIRTLLFFDDLPNAVQTPFQNTLCRPKLSDTPISKRTCPTD